MNTIWSKSVTTKIVIYVFVSFLILGTNPGYDLASSWIIILGGCTSGLKLFTTGISNIYTTNLSGEDFLRVDMIITCSLALIFWFGGMLLIYLSSKLKTKRKPIIVLVILWIFSSFYTIFSFGIMGV